MFFPPGNPREIKRKYGMPESLNLIVRLDEESGWFVIHVPELQGLVTQARGMDELVEMVNEAVLLYFDVPKRDADILYDRFQVGDRVLEYRGQLQTQPA
jgi:predicted RNase H-like HicB family nuclease